MDPDDRIDCTLSSRSSDWMACSECIDFVDFMDFIDFVDFVDFVDFTDFIDFDIETDFDIDLDFDFDLGLSTTSSLASSFDLVLFFLLLRPPLPVDELLFLRELRRDELPDIDALWLLDAD